MSLPRLGRMAYINTLPVDWGLINGALGGAVSIHRGTPTTLNRLLSAGWLDVSPVSSVAAAEHAHEWLVFDHLCIGCRGPVGSVILHSAVPVQELDGESITVTPESATAAKLLQILLTAHWKVDVKLVAGEHPARSRLLIGDSALKTAESRPPGFVYDLGEIWKRFTGRDFVFGLWCVRRRFAEEHPDETRAMYELLQASRSVGKRDSGGVTAQAARLTGLPRTNIDRYFGKLVYDLDDRLWSGLMHFLSIPGYDMGGLEAYGTAEWRAGSMTQSMSEDSKRRHAGTAHCDLSPTREIPALNSGLR